MCSLFLKDTNKERKDWNIFIGSTNQCGVKWKLGGREIIVRFVCGGLFILFQFTYHTGVKKFVVDIGWRDKIFDGTVQTEKLLYIIRLKA